MQQRTSPNEFACSLNDEEFRRRRRLIRRTLLPHIVRTEKLTDGLRLVFPASDELSAQVRQFVDLERQCCGFLSFTITPSGEHLVLTIEGPPEAAGTLGMFAATTEGR